MVRTRPWEVSDQWWEKIKPLIPPAPSHPRGGRPLKAINGRKKSIIWPSNIWFNAHERRFLCGLKLHKMAESAEINHNLAESANSANGFDRLLKLSPRFNAHEGVIAEGNLSTKIR